MMHENLQVEMLLQTDLAAFDTELREYAGLWPVRAGSPARINVSVWTTGLFEGRTVDRAGGRAATSERKAYAVTMKAPSPDQPVLFVNLEVTTIWVARINRDRIRMTVGACLCEEGRPFVADFIKHCEALWEGTLVPSQVPKNVAIHQDTPPDDSAQPPDPNQHGWPAVFEWDRQYGRRYGIASDKDLAKRLGLSHDHVRKKRSECHMPRRRPPHD